MQVEIASTTEEDEDGELVRFRFVQDLSKMLIETVGVAEGSEFVITTAVGYLSGQSALAVPMLFCLFAGAYLTYTLVPLRVQVDDGVGALILHIGYGITRGATWVGQLGCVGLLALWFL